MATLDDLRAEILAMNPGNFARVPYELYAELFPPGEPDDAARAACYRFVRALGCRIENKPEDQAVWIVKDA